MTSFLRSAEHGFTLGRSAENGFTLGRSAENGFTLIELLVALVIFGMLAAAGVTLLSGTVRAEAAVSRSLAEMASDRRAASAMTQDFAQAVPRISRTESGTLAPAFYARPEGDRRPLVQFVRGGWDNPDSLPRSDLQRLEYWIAGDRLERRASAMVDGAAATQTMVLATNVANVGFRFRDSGGGWQNFWTPAQPDMLPRAVELVIARRGQAPLTLLFLVGPGPLPKGVAGG